MAQNLHKSEIFTKENFAYILYMQDMAENLHKSENFIKKKKIFHIIARYGREITKIGKFLTKGNCCIQLHYITQWKTCACLAGFLAKQRFTFLIHLSIIFLLWISQILYLDFSCVLKWQNTLLATRVHTFLLHLPIIFWLCKVFTFWFWSYVLNDRMTGHFYLRHAFVFCPPRATFVCCGKHHTLVSSSPESSKSFSSFFFLLPPRVGRHRLNWPRSPSPLGHFSFFLSSFLHQASSPSQLEEPLQIVAL